MPNENQINLDLSSYMENKAAGTLQVVKLNGVTHYTSKTFDQKTGKPQPVLVPMDRDIVAKALEGKKQEVAIFTELLADIDAAPEKLAT